MLPGAVAEPILTGRGLLPSWEPVSSFESRHNPFHPRTGIEFDLLRYRRSWGRVGTVDGRDADGRVIGVPLAWTDVAPPDPFLIVSAGRSLFRVEDSLQLALLLRGQEW